MRIEIEVDTGKDDVDKKVCEKLKKDLFEFLQNYLGVHIKTSVDVKE